MDDADELERWRIDGARDGGRGGGADEGKL